MRLFGPFFHQAALHTTKCGGNHFLPSDSYLGQWRSSHDACDPRSISQMLAYAPHVSHKLKEFMWTQLGLRYTMKQIYDKHKEIWWARVNVGNKWPEMISYDSKISPIWIGSTRRTFGTNTQTQLFLFIHGFVLILMMFLISKMQVRWMGFMSLSP
jgi:hypothetical protein